MRPHSTRSRTLIRIIAPAATLILVLTVATPAFALSATVSDPQTNQTVTSIITQSGNTFSCSGRNSTTNGSIVDTIGVSWMCQFRDSAGVWHDFSTAPSATVSNASTTGTKGPYVDNPCVSSDGGRNLSVGDYPIRGQADGWTVNNGNRLNFQGSNAMHTGTIATIHCNA